jgi:cytochrome c553
MNKRMILAAVATLSLAPVHAAAADGEAAYVAKCQSCHGAEGNVPLQEGYPKLKGQNKAYLVQSFNAYKRGERTGANAMIMKGMSMTATDDEVEAISDYLSSL